jgi:surfactin synthase thioesterase subunit
MVDVRAPQIAGGLVVPGTDIDDSVWGDRPRGLTAGYTFEQGSGCARDPMDSVMSCTGCTIASQLNRERINTLVRPVGQGVWVRRFHEAGDASTRLVCFPHAGGSASYFFRLSAALSPEFNVCAIQYPGRQDRRSEPFVETIDDLADCIYAALNPVIDGPVAFFGHSMGAVVAFEVARRFEQRAQITPTTVFVSAWRGPSRLGDETIQLGDDADLVKKMCELGGTDPRLLGNKEMREMVLPAFRNDVWALERYTPSPDVRISAPIVVMTAVDDPSTTMEDAMAWHEHTSGGGTTHTFDGGHFYLERHAHRVITVIAETLRGRTPT